MSFHRLVITPIDIPIYSLKGLSLDILNQIRDIEWNDLPYGDEFGLVDDDSLRGHFKKHGKEFNAESEVEYLKISKDLLFEAMSQAISSPEKVKVELFAPEGMIWNGKIIYKGVMIVIKRCKIATCYRIY